MTFKFWENIKNYFYRRSLEQAVAAVKVEHSIITLDSAHTVGIIYDATLPANDAAILEFTEQLKNTGKEVEVLGFINDKKTESKPGIVSFNRKKLTWTAVPECAEVEKFAQKNFDLLLACFTGDNLPLQYIAGISHARWRVGVYAENKTGLYDMMVNMGDKNDLSYLLEQTVYFLNYIKPSVSEK